MSLYISKDPNAFFGRSSVWRKDDSTELSGDVLPYFPKKLMLGTTSICNLKCRHCLRGINNYCKPGRHMEKELYYNIIRDFLPKISAIYMGGSDLGEQMISPYFNYLLEEVGNYLIDLTLVSNLTLLTPQKAILLAKYCSLLEISVEGFGNEYEWCRGRKWKHLENNIRMLNEARLSHPKEKPLKIMFSVTTIRRNVQTYFHLLEATKTLNIDQIHFRPFEPFVPELKNFSFLYFPEESDIFYQEILNRAKELEVFCIVPPFFYDAIKGKPKRVACCLPWETIGIHADGTVFPCCGGGPIIGKYVPGEKNIMDLWNNKLYVKIRQTVNTKRPLSFCEGCEVVSSTLLPLAEKIKRKLAKQKRKEAKRKKRELIKKLLPKPIVKRISQYKQYLRHGAQ